MAQPVKIAEFACHKCGGTVRSQTGPGRTALYARGVPAFPIPADLDVPACDQCGEKYARADLEDELDDALRIEFLKWQKSHIDSLVKRLTACHGVTKQQVAGVCGVTPSHLSHLVHDGERQKRASMTLVRLLEALAAAPSEFRRQIEGKPFDHGVFVRLVARPVKLRAYASSSDPTEPAAPAADEPMKWDGPGSDDVPNGVDVAA